MRFLLAVLLALVPFTASADALLAVFADKGELVDPIMLIPVPKEGQTLHASLPEAGTPCASEHKVQRWVPLKCPPPMTVSATRNGDVVTLAMSMVDPKINISARTSAVENMALDFKNLEPTKTMKVRVETVILPDGAVVTNAQGSPTS